MASLTRECPLANVWSLIIRIWRRLEHIQGLYFFWFCKRWGLIFTWYLTEKLLLQLKAMFKSYYNTSSPPPPKWNSAQILTTEGKYNVDYGKVQDGVKLTSLLSSVNNMNTLIHKEEWNKQTEVRGHNITDSLLLKEHGIGLFRVQCFK